MEAAAEEAAAVTTAAAEAVAAARLGRRIRLHLCRGGAGCCAAARECRKLCLWKCSAPGRRHGAARKMMREAQQMSCTVQHHVMIMNAKEECAADAVDAWPPRPLQALGESPQVPQLAWQHVPGQVGGVWRCVTDVHM